MILTSVGRTIAARRLAGAALVVALAAACSSSSSGGATVAITASDSSCVVAKTTLRAGKTTFEVQNAGSDVTEVYVYAPGDRVVTERENIGPGTKATFSASLPAGDYEIACKPGQKGNGIRTKIAVTGAGGVSAKTPDRSVQVDAVDFSFSGLDHFTARRGETVKFDMINKGGADHELEVFAPDGQKVGEIGETSPGGQGTVTLTFDAPGTYRFVCDVADHAARGMKGTFTVS